jgi:hypothetical protein
MRLLDKISRPILQTERLNLIEEYQLKFNDLHDKLNHLKNLRNAIVNGFDGSNSQKN